MIRIAGAVCSISLLLAAAGGPSPATRPTGSIAIRNFVFEPTTDTVRVGQSVTFRNHDLVPHTATADNRKFDSASIAADSTWRFTARQKGVFTYHCSFHPTMRGTLVVR
jgi:plastocyanin